MRRSNVLEESSDLKGQCERERKSDICLESFSGVTGVIYRVIYHVDLSRSTAFRS